MSDCPQCSASLVEPRASAAYCEECGYPDENRPPHTEETPKTYSSSLDMVEFLTDLSNSSWGKAYRMRIASEGNVALASCLEEVTDGLSKAVCGLYAAKKILAQEAEQ